MDIPGTISISKRVKDNFQTIKNRTGVTINVLSRIAIVLAINSGSKLEAVAREDAGGQTLSRELMFGDLVDVFDVLVRQYMHDENVDIPVGVAVGSLIEIGAHKMSHCRSLEDLCGLA